MRSSARGNARRRQLQQNPDNIEFIATEARADLEEARRQYDDAARRLDNDSYAGIANTCLGGVIECETVLGILTPEEALGKIENGLQAVVDAKKFNPNSFVDVKGPECVIPPNSFALARSLEYFRLPRSIMGLCLGKSSYARCGIVVNITPLEPQWEGHLTIEISNTTPLPARIYSHEGIAQVLFFEAGSLPEVSYGDRKGKYQSQQGITLPKV